MSTYKVHSAGDETARRIARLVSESTPVDRIELRGLRAAARAEDEDALEKLLGSADTGYFEVERVADREVVDAVLSLLPSLTRTVFFAEKPVFARYDDGQIFVRISDQTAGEIRKLAVLERVSFEDSAEAAFEAEEGRD